VDLVNKNGFGDEILEKIKKNGKKQIGELFVEQRKRDGKILRIGIFLGKVSGE